MSENLANGKVRCIKIKSGHPIWLAPHLASNEKFLSDNGIRRAEAPRMDDWDVPTQEEKVEDVEQETAEKDTKESDGAYDGPLAKDLSPAQEALKVMNGINDLFDLESFIEGETRKGVLKAYDERRNELTNGN